MYADIFENASFFIRFGLASARRQHFRSLKTMLFENAQQRLRVVGDIFDNAPRVDADIFYTDRKRCVFQSIRIRVDEA